MWQTKKVLNEEELKQLSARMGIYWLALRNFDGFFSLLRDKHSNINSNQKIEQLKMFLDTVMQCWRRLNMSKVASVGGPFIGCPRAHQDT